MGDLNDDPTNKSLTQVLNAKRSSENLQNDELYNPMYDLYKSGNGTMAYRDAWSLFDQMVLSKGFVKKETGGWQLYKAVVYRQPWLLQTEGNFPGLSLPYLRGRCFYKWLQRPPASVFDAAEKGGKTLEAV